MYIELVDSLVFLYTLCAGVVFATMTMSSKLAGGPLSGLRVHKRARLALLVKLLSMTVR